MKPFHQIAADAVTIRGIIDYEDRRRKPTIFSRGMNPHTSRKPYILAKHIRSWHGNR